MATQRTVRLMFAGRIAATVCFRHVGIVMATVTGEGTIEIGPRSKHGSSTCELCGTVGGTMLDDLHASTDDADRLHVLHESLGYDPTDSDERALREIATELVLQAVITRLATRAPKDL